MKKVFRSDRDAQRRYEERQVMEQRLLEKKRSDIDFARTKGLRLAQRTALKLRRRSNRKREKKKALRAYREIIDQKTGSKFDNDTLWRSHQILHDQVLTKLNGRMQKIRDQVAMMNANLRHTEKEIENAVSQTPFSEEQAASDERARVEYKIALAEKLKQKSPASTPKAHARPTRPTRKLVTVESLFRPRHQQQQIDFSSELTMKQVRENNKKNSAKKRTEKSSITKVLAVKAEKDFVELQRLAIREFFAKTVGSVVYRIGCPPPLRLPTAKLLVVVLQSMKLRSQVLAFFANFFTHETSQHLLLHMFWFIYCMLYVPESKDTQAFLLELVSACYMKLVDCINFNDCGEVLESQFADQYSREKKSHWVPSIHEIIAIETNAKRHQDVFFSYYGFALAEAICLGLHTVFPLSRKKFSLMLKNLIMMEVNYVLSGLQLTYQTVEARRLRIFKENKTWAWSRHASEEITLSDLAQAEATDNIVSRNTSILALPNVYMSDDDYDSSFDGSESPHSKGSPSPTNKHGGSMLAQEWNDMVQEVSPKGKYQKEIEKGRHPLGEALGLLAQERSSYKRTVRHQPREKFCPHRVSPMGKIALKPRARAKAKPMLRTVPTKRCPYGGAENARVIDMAPSKAEALIHKNYKTHRFLHHQEQKQARHDTRHTVRQLEGIKKLVIKRGTNFLRHFSLDMMETNDRPVWVEKLVHGSKNISTSMKNKVILPSLSVATVKESKQDLPSNRTQASADVDSDDSDYKPPEPTQMAPGSPMIDYT